MDDMIAATEVTADDEFFYATEFLPVDMDVDSKDDGTGIHATPEEHSKIIFPDFDILGNPW